MTGQHFFFLTLASYFACIDVRFRKFLLKSNTHHQQHQQIWKVLKKSEWIPIPLDEVMKIHPECANIFLLSNPKAKRTATRPTDHTRAVKKNSEEWKSGRENISSHFLTKPWRKIKFPQSARFFCCAIILWPEGLTWHHLSQNKSAPSPIDSFWWYQFHFSLNL